MTDLTEICAECNNYFLRDYVNVSDYIHSGTFTIENHSISDISFLKPGQYFRIVGSDLNDGVYKNTTEGTAVLVDEEFDGAVWAMSVPPAFVALANDIAAWRLANESTNSKNMSPFSSESISGVYSYSKGSGGSADGGTAVTWKSQFKSRLNAYRRVYEL